MNARTSIYTSPGAMAYHVEFNSSKTYFCAALEDGFAVYTSHDSQLYSKEDLPGSIGTATMLGSTQIVGFISGGNKPQNDSRRLVLYDTTKHAQVAMIKTPDPIIRARISTKFIATVFERSVVLYRHQPTIEKVATYNTAPNPLGLCCLGELLAVFPGRSAGQLQVLDLNNMNVNIVPAHSSTLRAIELSPSEHIVASASDKGTLIRIHSSRTTARLTELRRGVTPATIFSLAISPSNDRIVVTSDTNTLHVFDLPTKLSAQPARTSRSPTPEPVHSPQNKWGSIGKLPFAPRVFSDVYSIASIAFDPGKESEEEGKGADAFVDIISGVPGGIPAKGVAAWIDDETIVVVSAGRDARYERFVLASSRDGGKLRLERRGWCRYLAPS